MFFKIIVKRIYKNTFIKNTSNKSITKYTLRVHLTVILRSVSSFSNTQKIKNFKC